MYTPPMNSLTNWRWWFLSWFETKKWVFETAIQFICNFLWYLRRESFQGLARCKRKGTKVSPSEIDSAFLHTHPNIITCRLINEINNYIYRRDAKETSLTNGGLDFQQKAKEWTTWGSPVYSLRDPLKAPKNKMPNPKGKRKDPLPTGILFFRCEKCQFWGGYTPQVEHGTWKMMLSKKVSPIPERHFQVPMLNFGRANFHVISIPNFFPTEDAPLKEFIDKHKFSNSQSFWDKTWRIEVVRGTTVWASNRSGGLAIITNLWETPGWRMVLLGACIFMFEAASIDNGHLDYYSSATSHLHTPKYRKPEEMTAFQVTQNPQMTTF